MPRHTAVWVNSAALERTLAHARAGGAPDDDIRGAERALFAAEGRGKGRFAMVIQGGFDEVQDLIPEHARHVLYTIRVFNKLVGTCDEFGFVMKDAEALARIFARTRKPIPVNAIHSVLVDLEAEPLAALYRLKRGRNLVGIELSPKVFRKPKPDPKRGRNGHARPDLHGVAVQ